MVERDKVCIMCIIIILLLILENGQSDAQSEVAVGKCGQVDEHAIFVAIKGHNVEPSKGCNKATKY